MLQQRMNAGAFPFGSVVTGSWESRSALAYDLAILRGPGRFLDFPRYRRLDIRHRQLALPLSDPQSKYGFTVISRFVGARSLVQHPDVLRCQTSSPL